MLGIVIPAYKRKDSLRQTLVSLTLQTKQSFYVIVIDDHSPESLKDVVTEFKRKLHIKYIYLDTNGGPGVARQAGLEYCYQRGFDAVIFLDSDDFLFPHAIDRLYHALRCTNSDIAIAGSWREGSNGEGAQLALKNKTFVHGKIYRTKFLQENNIRFPPLRTNEDLAFNLKAIELTNNIKILDDTLHLFHDESTSITRCGSNSVNLQLDYVRAIYDATKFLQARDNITPHMIINIFNCYNASQRGIILGGPLPGDVQDNIRELLAIPEVIDALQDWKYISKLPYKIQQMELIDGVLEPFPQTFLEWVKEYEL